MKLSEIHNCEKCHGKIVCISIDKLGVTRCGYCHQIVNYKELSRNADLTKFLKRVVEEKDNS